MLLLTLLLNGACTVTFLANKLSKGESIRAIVPSDFAFGALGNPSIPGYTPIIIELELLDYIL